MNAIKCVGFFAIALLMLGFVQAWEQATTYSFSSYGPGLIGNQWTAHAYDAGKGSYSLSRTAYGDYWGGYRAVSSRGNVHGGYFGYSNTYGVTQAGVYNPTVRGSIYRSPTGDYGGRVSVGQPQAWVNPYNYPVYHRGYNSYPLRYPNYYGTSLY
jgi:hypothetical protein